ncbi:MAG: hypothetical protein AAF572_28245 [Cyanobacteria bacterium P01_B01_bin.77]
MVHSALSVEFTGVTGVGKTTLVGQLKTMLRSQGLTALDAHDVILSFYRLSFVRSRPIRLLLIHGLSLLPFVRYISSTQAGPKLLLLAWQATRRYAQDWKIALYMLRTFYVLIGVWSLTKQAAHQSSDRREPCDFIFYDEGTLHILHTLFAHTSTSPDSAAIEKFAAWVPLPDVSIWLTSDLDQSIQCTLNRGHKRVQPNTLETATMFVNHSHQAFELFFDSDHLQTTWFKVDCSPSGATPLSVNSGSDQPSAALAVSKLLKNLVIKDVSLYSKTN